MTYQEIENNSLFDYNGQIKTLSNGHINFLNPQPDQFCIEDIAAGCANACRFGGQTKPFLSSAEHARNVSLLREAMGDATPDDLLAALLHDATDGCGLLDLPKPLKLLLPDYQKIEAGMLVVIFKCFDLPAELLLDVKDGKIKQADKMAGLMEYAAIYKKETLVFLDSPAIRVNFYNPEYAEYMFIQRFNQIQTLRGIYKNG